MVKAPPAKLNSVVSEDLKSGTSGDLNSGRIGVINSSGNNQGEFISKRKRQNKVVLSDIQKLDLMIDTRLKEIEEEMRQAEELKNTNQMINQTI